MKPNLLCLIKGHTLCDCGVGKPFKRHLQYINGNHCKWHCRFCHVEVSKEDMPRAARNGWIWACAQDGVPSSLPPI